MRSIINYTFSVILACTPMVSHAFKLDTHLWVGQQIINDLEDDGKLTIKLGRTSVNLDVRDEVKNAILANKSAYLMGNIGPDAAPDVVVGQTAVHPGVKDSEGDNIGWQTNDWLEYLLRVSESNEIGTAYTYGYLGHAAADVFAHTYVNQYAGDIFSLEDETLVEQRHFVLENYIGKHTPPLVNHLGENLGAPWDQVEMNDELAEFIRDNLIYNEEVESEYWKVPTATHLAAYARFRKGVDSLAEDGIWHDIDIAVTMVVAAFFDIELSPDEAEQIVDAAQPVLDKLNDVSEDIQELTNEMYDHARKFDEQVFSSVTDAAEEMEDAEQDYLSKHQEWRRKLLDVENLPSCPKIYYIGGFPPRVKSKEDPVCKATKDLIQASNNLILDAAELLENETLNLKNDLVDATIKLRNETVKAADSVHAIQNSLTDFGQMISADVSPIQSILRGWRSDIDIAMSEYVKATNQAMINTMNPSESATDPIIEWFNCYQLSIIGLPSSLSGCEFRGGINNLTESIDNVLTILSEADPLGITSEINNLKDKLIEDLMDSLKEEIKEQIVDLLPEEIIEIMDLLDLQVNDEILNQYFTKAETIAEPKGLIMIPDMAERVKSEMFLMSSNTFDPEKYAVVYNAVVLAKLALLDNDGYSQLASKSGSVDYVDYLFDVDNLVAQAFGNIDGNHQWMSLPPPIPNSFGNYSEVDYTYSSDRSAVGESGGLGFVPWKGDMRDKVFRKVFIGPLSPGIDSPSLVSKTNIVDSKYPYQPCAAHPFPSDTDDRTCISIILIPILSILMN